MKNIIEKVFSVIEIISFLALVIVVIDGFVYEILGAEMYEKLLRWLKIPLSGGEIFKISCAGLVIFLSFVFCVQNFLRRDVNCSESEAMGAGCMAFLLSRMTGVNQYEVQGEKEEADKAVKETWFSAWE